MIEMQELARRRELGDFVRAQRERMAPEAGMIAARRRRTPGLRREEVAQLAGLAPPGTPGSSRGETCRCRRHALARLARTLRLDRAQRTYLFELAGKRDPDHGGSDERRFAAGGARLPGRDRIACLCP